MALLELLGGLFDLYLWLVAGPRAVIRLVRRIKHPTPEEKAVSATPEMQAFRRDTWLIGWGWLALSAAAGVLAASPWIGLIAVMLGLLFLPGLIEKRYDRLVEKLQAKPAA